MKKILALLLASVMVLGLAACGGDNTPAEDTDAGTKEPATTTETSANDIPDSMTSEDGKYELAFVTDVGQLKDKSFNEGTWKAAQTTAVQVFEQGAAGGELPSISVNGDIGILDAFLQIGFVASKGEARRLIKQNGLKINDEVICDENYVISAKDYHDGQVKLSQGKKKHGLIKAA